MNRAAVDSDGDNSPTRRRGRPYGFGKAQRLRRGADFQQVFQQRLSVADNVLVVYGRRNQAGIARLGLSVSRKSGNAPTRNYWKRSIREAFRRLPAWAEGWDLVVIPRRGVEADANQIAASLPALVARLQRKERKRARPTPQQS